MIVRSITAGEIQAAHDIGAIAFVVQRQGEPEPPKPDAYRRVRAAFDDTGRMTACLDLPVYQVRFGAHTVEMCGVGGVASLPETRRQGNIRALFEYSLREMYEEGMVFSALYPFSHAYYRQFGYELTCERREIKADMDVFAGFRASGTLRQWMPGEDDAPLRAIYDEFMRKTNLSNQRTDAQWKKWLDASPYEKRQYTYVWHDDAGQPRAYMILRVAEKPEGKELQAAEVACCDNAALLGLFTLLRSMGAGYKTFAWDMPMWIDPNTLFPEPYDLKQTILQRGMARIVSVRQTLSLLRYPDAPGAFSLRVTDEQLPQNEGVWQVSFGGGEPRVEKRADGPADWSLDIRALTQIALGYLDVDGLLWSRPGLEHPANRETLERVFVRRAVSLTEFF